MLSADFTAAATTTTTPTKSPLDKPLHLLTEYDISQLTREDCRRYLKIKGMRRPSWNKSQAIQQVISLKKLLEPPPDVGAGDAIGSRKKPVTTLAPVAEEENRSWDDSRISRLAAEDSVSFKYQSVSDCSGDPSSHQSPVAAADVDLVSLRLTEETPRPAGQMTIFYCGKVNVYDDMPYEKAQTIMQLAASSLKFAENSPSDVSPALRPYSCHLQSPSVKVCAGSSGPVCPTSQTDGSASSRKASVQRYREKRKDRLKRRVGTPLFTGLDINVEPPGRRLSHTINRCSSEDNATKNGNFSTDLNDNGDDECR